MRKKILSTALCAAMVLASTTVFAAPSTTDTGSGDATGQGSNEGLINTEIYSVTLPTVTGADYNFYLDPQGNINSTNAARYSNCTPSGATNAYFKTSSNTLTEKSVSTSVVNASYNDLDVTIKVEITGNTNISIEESNTIDSDTPTMYMGLESEVREDASNTGSLPSVGSGVKDVSYVPSSGTLEKTFKLSGDAIDYQKSWNSGASEYQMANVGSSGAQHADSTLDFNLVVGCNTVDDADWTDAVADTPSVKVTWSYGKHVDFTFAPTSVATNSSDGSKFVIAPASTVSSITSVKVINKQTGATLGTLSTSDYVLASSGKIAVVKSAVSTAAGGAGTYGVVVKTDVGDIVFEAIVD